MTKDLPLISIVIPVYNRRELVFEAIASALAQTYPAREVVVVDDASTDGTYERLRCSGLPIVLWRQPVNQGQSAARNRGWRCCRGEYVLFLDSDDVLEPRALDALWYGLSQARHQGPDWVASYGRKLTCDARLNPVKVREKAYYHGELLPPLLFNNFVRTGTYLVKKSVLAEVGGFKEDLAVKEDLNLHFSIAARYQFAFVDTVVSRYRRHPGLRARNNFTKLFEQETGHLDYLFAEHPELPPSVWAARPRAYRKEYIHLSKMAWRSRQWRDYLYYWGQALSYERAFILHPKYLIRAMASAMKLYLL